MAPQISEERKARYNVGLVMIIIGGCLFGLPFIAIPLVIITGISSGGRDSGILHRARSQGGVAETSIVRIRNA